MKDKSSFFPVHISLWRVRNIVNSFRDYINMHEDLNHKEQKRRRRRHLLVIIRRLQFPDLSELRSWGKNANKEQVN